MFEVSVRAMFWALMRDGGLVSKVAMVFAIRLLGVISLTWIGALLVKGVTDKKVILYVAINVGNTLLGHMQSKSRNQLTTSLHNLWFRNELYRFADLTFQKKYEIRTKFHSRVIQMHSYFEIQVDTLTGDIPLYISSIGVTAWVFYVQKLVLLFILLLIGLSVIGKLMIPYFSAKIDLTSRKMRKKRDVIYDVLAFRVNLLAQGQGDIKQLCAINSSDEEVTAAVYAAYSLQSRFIEMTTGVLPLVLLFSDSDNLVVFYYVMMKFIEACNKVARYLEHQQRTKRMQTEYEDLFTDAKYHKSPGQRGYFDTFQIRMCDGLIGGFIHVPDMTFKRNDKVLITGASGAGKTTFMNALQGFIPGLRVNGLDPASYSELTALHTQESLRVDRLSLYDLFGAFYDGNFEEGLAKKYIMLVQLGDFFNTTIEGDFHRKLDKITPSGGETTRLNLALTLYRARLSKSQVLILDEPSTGVDPDKGYDIIRDVVAEFHDRLVIVTSHLERIKEKDYWTAMLEVVKRDGRSDVRIAGPQGVP